MSPRRLTLWLWLVAVLAVPMVATGTVGAAIEPPWCGTPIPDGTAALPDGSSPTHPVGSYPHIPWYAIGCTLERIQSESHGRMTYRVSGQSALGKDMYVVTINALDTKAQRRGFSNWKKIRRHALTDPARAQDILAKAGDGVKVPLFISAGIHGNESEGIDASLMLIERIATTPNGADAFVDDVLNHSILIVNVIQNPDGHILDQRANGNNFDLNRDWLTQSQPETKATFPLIQQWLPADLLDQHGYVTPTLVEATTKPHNPGIEYDMWLKWNQGRIDANEAAMNAIGYAITRPINDWCWDGEIPVNGICVDDDGNPDERPNDWGPKWAESWDDWGPFYTPMYSQLVGLNGSTVEMCRSTGTGCLVPGTTLAPPRGRLGARTAQYTVATSTLTYDIANRVELMNDQLEVYRRGVTDAARPTTADLPPGFDNEENNWMHDYPQAYVIPVGEGQRSDVEAGHLANWLLSNGIRVDRIKKGYDFGSTRFEEGSYVVFMDQALRGLADTALGAGVDVSSRISILYAPPGAWSHGYLWGADVVTIPDSAAFDPKTKQAKSVSTPPGGVDGATGATAFALAVNSPTAVRTLNSLLGTGLTAELATAPFMNALGKQMPAGTVLFPAGARAALESAGVDAGIWFYGVTGALPAREAIDRSPRIAVLAGAVNQDVWVLRNLGFTADPVSTGTINTAATDPLLNYDVIFNTAGYPDASNVTGRARITNFLANGGGYLGALTNGANFLTAGGQVTGLTAANRGGNGRSGIINWNNTAPGTSLITGAYRSQDTAIVDPPTWFTAVPSTMTVDGSLPLTGFFLSGLWLLDAQSASAPGSAMIAHGTNTAGTARITSFAMNPLYRADPEREWPMIASAALWVDQ
jgi:zinc carboxypeptidase